MPRITKGMIQVSISELKCICDLANEAHAIDGSGLSVLRFHARSANNYLDVLKRAGHPLPERILAKRAIVEGCGWRLS